MTITTATSSRSFTISSSIFSVDCGSSAEHGSSSSSTSGLATRARAMQSRCCWPPESFSAGCERSSLTSSKRPARSSASQTAVLERAPAPPPRALLAQDVGEVVEHAHRERVRLLEHHRHAAPQRGRLHRLDVDAVERDPAVQRRRAGQLGEPVERAQQGRLAAAGGADQGEHLALADRQRDLLDGELRRRRRPRARRSPCGGIESCGAPILRRLARREAGRRGAVAVSVPGERVAALGSLLGLGRVLEVEAPDGRWLQEFHEPAFRERRWTTSTAAFRSRTMNSRTNAAAYAFCGWLPSPVGAL